MTSMIFNLVILLLMLASLTYIFKTPIVKYMNVRKRKARREDLFYINPRMNRREHLRSHLTKLNRIFLLTRQNIKAHEDKVKFLYGEVFELDNRAHVDTSKVYDINIPSWTNIVASAIQKNRIAINCGQITVIQFVKNTSLFVRHQLKSMSKHINRLQQAVTKYIHNNGGDDTHGQK